MSTGWRWRTDDIDCARRLGDYHADQQANLQCMHWPCDVKASKSLFIRCGDNWVRSIGQRIMQSNRQAKPV